MQMSGPKIVLWQMFSCVIVRKTGILYQIYRGNSRDLEWNITGGSKYMRMLESCAIAAEREKILTEPSGKEEL